MKKDVLTTIGGLVLVGLVVVATFLYGSQQRQNQAKHDEQLKQQQQTAQQSTDEHHDADKPQQPAVNKPQADQSNLQGGKPATAPAPVPAGSTQTPKTGGEVLFIIPAAAMVAMYRRQRRSQRELRQALLTV